MLAVPCLKLGTNRKKTEPKNCRKKGRQQRNSETGDTERPENGLSG